MPDRREDGAADGGWNKDGGWGSCRGGGLTGLAVRLRAKL